LEKINKVPLLLDVAAAPFFNFKDESPGHFRGSARCRHPVGLAAGFDKNAKPSSTPISGFGFLGIGPSRLSGTMAETSRLFRLKKISLY